MILLGFDVEEFDMPFEYGKSIPFDEQLEISTRGTNTILKLLGQKNIKVTFFALPIMPSIGRMSSNRW
ncbi:hypothetical protein ACRQ5D_00135 [Mucilaginibacter sp. P25]|uniref:hypothetical protein n=1 Tax=unclassified Mucilaginibacter TaxID=2617802 RepID=UPI003D67AC03